MSRFILILIVILTLSACCGKNYQITPKTEFNLVVRNCEELADAMNAPEHPKGSLFWNNYFESCMENNGYSKAQYQHLWY